MRQHIPSALLGSLILFAAACEMADASDGLASAERAATASDPEVPAECAVPGAPSLDGTFPPPRPPERCDAPVFPEDLVSDVDDGDGALDLDELAALHRASMGRAPLFTGPPPLPGPPPEGAPGGSEDRRPPPPPVQAEEMIRRHIEDTLRLYDVDRSASLDGAERDDLAADHRAGCEAHRGRFLARFDTDGSGDLDDDERRAARDLHHAIMDRHREASLARFDVDGSGDLEDDERRAMMDEGREAIEGLRGALFDVADEDGSGDLDDDEAEALRSLVRERIQNGC